MRHTTGYRGDISTLRGAHVLYNDEHRFYASYEGGMKDAFELDEAGEEYELDICPPTCPYRP